jgi:hypothetical protein
MLLFAIINSQEGKKGAVLGSSSFQSAYATFSIIHLASFVSQLSPKSPKDLQEAFKGNRVAHWLVFPPVEYDDDWPSLAQLTRSCGFKDLCGCAFLRLRDNGERDSSFILARCVLARAEPRYTAVGSCFGRGDCGGSFYSMNNWGSFEISGSAS